MIFFAELRDEPSSMLIGDPNFTVIRDPRLRSRDYYYKRKTVENFLDRLSEPVGARTQDTILKRDVLYQLSY